MLFIFPQGIIRPPHYRPIEFQTGLAYIAQKGAKKFLADKEKALEEMRKKVRVVQINREGNIRAITNIV